MCGERQTAPLVEQLDELHHYAEARQKLQRMSAATIDQLLSTEKRKLRLCRRSYTTKPTMRLMQRSSATA